MFQKTFSNEEHGEVGVTAGIILNTSRGLPGAKKEKKVYTDVFLEKNSVLKKDFFWNNGRKR